MSDMVRVEPPTTFPVKGVPGREPPLVTTYHSYLSVISASLAATAVMLVLWPSYTVTLAWGWRVQLMLVPGQVMTAILLLSAVIREAVPFTGKDESAVISATVW